MSAFNPPTYTVSIYNPAFFPTSTTGISQSQANALYLQKTTADTATALETFSSGIATNSVATTTTASNLLIGSSSNTGTITIATVNTGNTDASPAISIGADSGTKTIKINNNTNSVHCSSLDITGSGINNITNATGSVDIGNLQTSGVLNIGVNGSRTGAINIATNGGQSTNITVGASSTSAFNVASPFSTFYPLQLTYTSIPTLSTNSQGYRTTLVTNGTATTSGTANTVTQWSSFSVPAGIWIVEVSLFVNASSIAYFEHYISSTTGSSDSSRAAGGNTSSTSGCISRNTVIINTTSTASWYLNGKSSGVSIGITTIYVTITRIT